MASCLKAIERALNKNSYRLRRFQKLKIIKYLWKIILTKDFFCSSRTIIVLRIQISLGLTSDSHEPALAQLYAMSFEGLCLKLEFSNRINIHWPFILQMHKYYDIFNPRRKYKASDFHYPILRCCKKVPKVFRHLKMNFSSLWKLSKWIFL